jgi:hypothetical protein
VLRPATGSSTYSPVFDLKVGPVEKPQQQQPATQPTGHQFTTIPTFTAPTEKFVPSYFHAGSTPTNNNNQQPNARTGFNFSVAMQPTSSASSGLFPSTTTTTMASNDPKPAFVFTPPSTVNTPSPVLPFSSSTSNQQQQSTTSPIFTFSPSHTTPAPKPSFTFQPSSSTTNESPTPSVNVTPSPAFSFTAPNYTNNATVPTPVLPKKEESIGNNTGFVFSFNASNSTNNSAANVSSLPTEKKESSNDASSGFKFTFSFNDPTAANLNQFEKSSAEQIAERKLNSW